MKVTVTENIAIGKNVVNRAEGIPLELEYSTDSTGNCYANVAYMCIPGCDLQALLNNDVDLVTIFPSTTSILLGCQVPCGS
jgi:hypothetical protein